MTLEEITKVLSNIKPKLTQTYNLETLGIFGSYARGDNNNSSDLDLLISFSKPVGFEIVDLVMELESTLNIPIDVITKDSIKTRLWEEIQPDIIYV